MKRLGIMSLGVALVLACAAADAAETPGRFVSVQGDRFVDPEGRQVLLRGVNVVDKSAKWTQWPWLSRDDFGLISDWGLNCIRLGFVWAGIEPEPGRYDEDYIAEIDNRIGWARDHGLYVYLDMHQDLWGMAYSDGAPAWATLTDGKPHDSSGTVWSDAYLKSAAVQTAFDNFWANKPGPDGVGIQERYALAWKHLAERYADEPTVIGYDLMNEPFIGSDMLLGQMAMVTKLAECLRERDGETAMTIEDLAGMWTNREGRSKAVEMLGDMDLYVPTTDAGYDVYAEFERTKLTAMFQRVTNAIREVDGNHIIFLETNISANMGMHTGIEPVLGPDGKRDPQQAYAPHGYDIVVDTADLAKGSNDRVEFIFTRHGESAERLGMPMIVGEWGAFPARRKGLLSNGRFLVRQFEKLKCGDSFWHYVQGLDQSEFLEIIQRPYPVAVAGTLLEYESDPEALVFQCVWQENPAITAPSVIYLPDKWLTSEERVELTPLGDGFNVEPVRDGSSHVRLVIPPTGEATERRLTIKP